VGRLMRAALGLAALLGWTGCGGGTTRPDQLTITHSESVDVGGGPALPMLTGDGLNPPGLGVGVTQQLSTQLDNQGAQEGDIRAAAFTQFKLEVTAPLRNGEPAQDLRFLDGLAVFISAAGLPELKVAESLSPPAGTSRSASFGPGITTVELPLVPGLNLKDYVTAEGMAVRVEVTANGRPALSCTVTFTVAMRVDLNPAGAAQNRLGG